MTETLLAFVTLLQKKKIHYQHILQMKLHFGVGRISFLTPFPWTVKKPEEPAPALLIV